MVRATNAPQIHIESGDRREEDTIASGGGPFGHVDVDGEKRGLDSDADAAPSGASRQADRAKVEPARESAGPNGTVGQGQGDIPGGADSVKTPPSGQQGGTSWSPMGWLSAHFPGHERMALGALCGLLIALLVFAIGFWRTLLIVVLVFLGSMVGLYLDGDTRFVELVRQIIAGRRR